MPLLQWDTAFELGIEQFDEHHKHLVMLLNEVYDDFTGGGNAERLGIVLDRLLDYAVYHFMAEEEAMAVSGYPKLARHRKEHRKFTANVLKLKEDFRNGKALLLNEVLAFLRNWLTDHILHADADFGRFVATQTNG